MATRIGNLGLALLLILASGPAYAQLKSEDAIQNALNEYALAWNNRDHVALASMYTLDGDYTGFDGAVKRGRDAISDRYQLVLSTTLSGSHLSVDMGSLRFLKPDTALVDGTLKLEISSRADGTIDNKVANFVAVMLNEDGQWRFTAVWSSSLRNPPQHPTE
jgi:uncharacterized protein (TIGR02246 family)